MSIWHLVVSEIAYRKLSFGLSVLSVVVAVGCVVGALTLLQRHDLCTQEIIAEREADTEDTMRQRAAETRTRMELLETATRQQMARLEDDYRKITKNLGFNVLILPRDQNLGDLYADDFASKYMPEEYADKLAQSRVVTINHLLPSLQQKLKWPEHERTIILIGTRGEVPLLHPPSPPLLKGGKGGVPILSTVPPGTMVVGYELHRGLKLTERGKVTLLGREFTVHKLHPERGTKDDITVWINLAEAQELLGKKGLINAILALECNCSADRLGKIRAEIAAVLPDTQVIELATQALARAEARNRAGAEAKYQLRRAADEARYQLEQEAVRGKSDIARAQAERTGQRQRQEAVAAVLVPLVVAGCIIWLGIMAFVNVRSRLVEIGILRALGVRAAPLLSLFLARAVLVGLCGAIIGSTAGVAVSAAWGEQPTVGASLLPPVLFLLVLVGAPALSGLASWLPALWASQQDPAVVLREE